MKKFFISLSLCLLCGHTLWAADAWNRWSSLAKLEAAAYNNNPTAMSDLGRYYFATEQYAQALPWLERAAGKNSSEGLFMLGYCYETGLCGKDINTKKAVGYYKRAAAKKNPNALYRLGRMMLTGKAGKVNAKKGVQYLEKAAEKHSWDAQNFLAEAYCSGQVAGIEQDYKEAQKAWQKLSDGGDLQARYHLAELYEQGKGAAMDLHRAFELYASAATEGYAPAAYKTALAYLEGRGVEMDTGKGLQWLETAAAQNYAPAQEKLKSRAN